VIISFGKSHKKLSSATADAENVALLTNCNYNTGGKLCLLSADLAGNC
jgi:hypothetical protein